MAKDIAPFTCDICGTRRQETNHWFVAWIDKATTPKMIRLSEWDDNLAEIKETSHICGLDCLAKLVVKEVSKWNANS